MTRRTATHAAPSWRSATWCGRAHRGARRRHADDAADRAVYVLATAIAMVSTVFRPAQAAMTRSLAEQARGAARRRTPSPARIEHEHLLGSGMAVSCSPSAGRPRVPRLPGSVPVVDRAVWWIDEPPGGGDGRRRGRGADREPWRGSRRSPRSPSPGGDGDVRRAGRDGCRRSSSSRSCSRSTSCTSETPASAIWTAPSVSEASPAGSPRSGWPGRAGSRRRSRAGVLAWGVGVALLGLTTTTVVALVLLAGVGVGNTVVDVAAVTLLQRSGRRRRARARVRRSRDRPSLGARAGVDSGARGDRRGAASAPR